jgi:hypothetical protein
MNPEINGITPESIEAATTESKTGLHYSIRYFALFLYQKKQKGRTAKLKKTAANQKIISNALKSL